MQIARLSRAVAFAMTKSGTGQRRWPRLTWPQFGSRAGPQRTERFPFPRRWARQARKGPRQPMFTAATSRKASAGSPNAKNGKSRPTTRPNNARPATGSDHGGRTKPNWFTTFAQHTAHLAGRPITFLLAVITI